MYFFFNWKNILCIMMGHITQWLTVFKPRPKRIGSRLIKPGPARPGPVDEWCGCNVYGDWWWWWWCLFFTAISFDLIFFASDLRLRVGKLFNFPFLPFLPIYNHIHFYQITYFLSSSLVALQELNWIELICDGVLGDDAHFCCDWNYWRPLHPNLLQSRPFY